MNLDSSFSASAVGRRVGRNFLGPAVEPRRRRSGRRQSAPLWTETGLMAPEYLVNEPFRPRTQILFEDAS